MPSKTKYSNPPKRISPVQNNYTGNSTVIESLPRHLDDSRSSDVSVMRNYSPNRKMQNVINDMADIKPGQRNTHPSATCTIKGSKVFEYLQSIRSHVC